MTSTDRPASEHTGKPLPHEYSVTAAAKDEGSVLLAAHALAPIESAPPRDFGGPGDQWSPEELLLAALVDCFVLTFRAGARASSLQWTSIDAKVDGLLAKAEQTTRFTELTVNVTLTLEEAEVHHEKALRLLEKAKCACPVTNSLAAPVKLESRVVEASPR